MLKDLLVTALNDQSQRYQVRTVSSERYSQEKGMNLAMKSALSHSELYLDQGPGDFPFVKIQSLLSTYHNR